jgi:hypothetical protein
VTGLTTKASAAAGRTGRVNLGAVTFSASIDFVSIEVSGRTSLPALTGKPNFSRREHYRVLTVQQATAEDVVKLDGLFGCARLLELEVAVDVSPRPRMQGKERLQLLEDTVIDLFASELDPSRARGMRNQFRAFYRRLENGYIIRPFNLKLPIPTDQQLHGGRDDDCQVKVYLKRTDQKKQLREADWVARVEVRLSGDGLESRNLSVIHDMFGFRFRKQLMPFFTHVRGSRRRKRVTKVQMPRNMRDGIDRWRNSQDREVFKRHGVGALQGHKVLAKDVRLLRDTPVNNRVGQALLRLERQFRGRNIRAFSDGADDG